MKTIVFHSYKGGVGRTLALANFAKALMRAGKRVVALELDFDAPDLHRKFSIDHVEHGYVDYLIDTVNPASGNVDYFLSLLRDPVDGHERLSMDAFKSPYRNDIPLKQYAYPLANDANDGTNGSYLIPAGNSMAYKYWGLLASEEFNRRFYLRPSQMIDERIGDWLADHNIKWFKNDLEKIEAEFSPDYLLIDCKTANERSAVPLLVFADEVVSMFSLNVEGIKGTVIVQKALKDSGKRITTVVCRVPNQYSARDARSLKEGVFSKTWKQQWPDVEQPDGDFAILHEYRGLETVERLLLGGGNQESDLGALLSHDYVHLFKRLAPEIENGLAAQGTNWKSLLGMAQEVEVVEQFFDLYVSGPMLNRDKQANVALRVDTLRSMLDSIYQEYVASATGEEEKEAAAKKAVLAFRNAGHAAGESFGREMMETDKVFPSGPPADSGERLAVWSQFDSEVGFGRIAANLSVNAPINGTITVKNNFLTTGRKYGEPDINSFFCGYLEGVLEKLLEQPILVSFTTDNETFTFEIATS